MKSEFMRMSGEISKKLISKKERKKYFYFAKKILIYR